MAIEALELNERLDIIAQKVHVLYAASSFALTQHGQSDEMLLGIQCLFFEIRNEVKKIQSESEVN